MNPSIEFSSSLLAAYAVRTGWHLKSQGNEGSLYVKSLKDREIYLPIPIKTSKDLFAYRTQISRLAEAENRSESSILLDLKNYNQDVIRLKGASELWNGNSIPLKSGVGLVNTAYKMLRAIATTSRSPKSYIGSSFSKIGESLISSVTLGQSEPGSYILPVIVPLTEVNIDQNYQNFLAPTYNIEFLPESPERKITAALSRALSAIDTLILRPASLPNVENEINLVVSGVSHELLVTISDFLSHPSVENFNISFDWAYAEEIPSKVAKEINFTSGSAEALNQVAQRLKTKLPSKKEIITGEIVTLHRPLEEDANYVVVATIRKGRMSKIYVDLNYDQFESALSYAKQHRPVIVEGDIYSHYGKPPRIVKPTRFIAVDETLLPN